MPSRSRDTTVTKFWPGNLGGSKAAQPLHTRPATIMPPAAPDAAPCLCEPGTVSAPGPWTATAPGTPQAYHQEDFGCGVYDMRATLTVVSCSADTGNAISLSVGYDQDSANQAYMNAEVQVATATAQYVIAETFHGALATVTLARPAPGDVWEFTMIGLACTAKVNGSVILTATLPDAPGGHSASTGIGASGSGTVSVSTFSVDAIC